MTAEQLGFLGYFCITEVASQDPRVGLPVDIAIIPKDGKTYFLDKPTLENFHLRHKKAHRYMNDLFSQQTGPA